MHASIESSSTRSTGDQGEEVADYLCRQCYYGFEAVVSELPRSKDEMQQFVKHHFVKACNDTLQQPLAQSSGTTATIVLIDYRDDCNVAVVCVTVGDSTAIAVSVDENDPNLETKVTTLTAQHRTTTESERSRIVQAGGLLEGQFVVWHTIPYHTIPYHWLHNHVCSSLMMMMILVHCIPHGMAWHGNL
jgi:serine/threonine protein phosphatase PrpC